MCGLRTLQKQTTWGGPEAQVARGHPIKMPDDRQGPQHLIPVDEVENSQWKSGTSSNTSRRGPAARSSVLLLLTLLALAGEGAQGWTAAYSRTGASEAGMLSAGKRGGAAMALRWKGRRCSDVGSVRLMARRMAGAGGAFAPPAGWSPTPATDVNYGRGYHSAAAGAAFRTAIPPPRMAASASTAPSATKKAPAPAKKKRAAAAVSKRSPVASKTAAAKKKGLSSSKDGDKKVLVIVESPAKARTITALLEKAGAGDGGKLYRGYTVDACNGHVTDLVGKRRDVPAELKEATKGWDVVGVDVENNFEPLYIQNAKKKPIINRLKKASAKCDEIILATDEDREGEAISWHLLQVLEPKVPVKRAVFHEITQEALVKAFEEPGEIDENLVQAQEARRILDRLAGFTLTPVIWNFVAPGLSAGRVQSVALAMVVERERARLKFKSAEYWDVVANVTAAGQPERPFEARLVQVGSKTVVGGKDFDPDTGEIKEKLDASKLELLGSEKASAVATSPSLESLRVLKVDKRRVRRQPPAPFITSTLQQEASRKLRLGVDQTMRAAQALYEAGYITYMRTDRPSLSKEAAGVAERAVRDSFGDEFVRKGEHSPAPCCMIRKGGAASSFSAWADLKLHANSGNKDGSGLVSTLPPAGTFLHPSDLPQPEEGGLEEQQRALYDLVYRRTLASAMAESEADFTTVSLGADGVSIGGEAGDEEVDVVFKASGKTTVFEGFLKAYSEGSDEALPPAEGAGWDAQETELPVMVEGGSVGCEQAKPVPHRTSPPRRYTEASFIKELEAKGVGRPSTYASIIGTLRTRTYVNMQGRTLTPSLTGFVVADLLREHFPDFTDTGFTAKMEDKLDAIARGEKGRVDYLSEYYLGESGLKESVARKRADIDPLEAKRARLPGLESLDNRCSILVGPYGGYLVPDDGDTAEGGGSADGKSVGDLESSGEIGTGVDGDGEEKAKSSSAVTLPYVAQDNLELLTVDLVERCLDSTYRGGDLLGQHPDTGEDIRIRMGRYGPYLECGDKQASAFAHISEANKKDPTDLSLPSQPTPTELFQQRQQQQQQQTGGGAATGAPADAAVELFSPAAAAAGADVAAAKDADGIAYQAEDIIAFGLGANTTGSDGGDEIAGGSGGGGGGGGVGTWYSAVSLERAVGLLSLPRVVCESHPTEGGAIEVGVGRFGVWVKHKDSFKNVPGGVDVLDVDEELAVQLTDEMIQRNKDRPTIEIGTLDGEKVFIKYGKYGRCISCDGTVVMLPSKYRKTKKNPEPEEIPLDEAIELVLEKRANDGPAARAKRKKKGGSSKGTSAGAAGAGAVKKRATKAGSKKTGRSIGGKRAIASTVEKRPLSGFFRFCKESRETHTAAMAGEGAGTAGATLNTETLSARWKELAEGERAEFNAASSAALEQWKADNSNSGSSSGGGGGGGGGNGSGGSVKRIPPPKNAYILFSSERRPRLKEEVDGDLSPVEMTRRLAHEWRELEGSSVREEYARRAAMLREAWLKEKEEAADALRGAPV
ncbi:unnamed protein product [Scytosiphon promiscuus]